MFIIDHLLFIALKILFIDININITLLRIFHCNILIFTIYYYFLILITIFFLWESTQNNIINKY